MPQLTVNQALQQAIEHQNHGRFAEAEKIYRTILKQVPDQPEVLHLMGLLSHQTGDDEAGERHIRRALMLAPDRAKFRLSLGMVLQGRGKVDEAIGLYRAVVEAQPASAEGFNHLGVALSAAGR